MINLDPNAQNPQDTPPAGGTIGGGTPPMGGGEPVQTPTPTIPGQPAEPKVPFTPAPEVPTSGTPEPTSTPGSQPGQEGEEQTGGGQPGGGPTTPPPAAF